MPKLDAESEALVYEGASLSNLAKMFGMDNRTVKERLGKGGVKPIGMRGIVAVYEIREAAGHLVKPAYDIETYIRRMNHKDLPQHLTKEFWAGQRSKQEYELRAGNLWPTERVVAEVGELYKMVKMSALLMLDAVERKSELSDVQREVVKNLTHGMLDDLVQRIEKNFNAEAPSELPQEQTGHAKPQEDEDDQL